MNIKILAASMSLLAACAVTQAQARDHFGGGHDEGHWSHDSRGGGYGNRGGEGRGGWHADHWGNDRREHHDRYDDRGYRGGHSWGNDRHYYYRDHDDYRRDHWRHDYHPYGYGSDYSYAPRYYAPYYYAPSYYAPRPWGGWFDDLGVVIQFSLP